MFGWLRNTAEQLFGRSGSWATVRRAHLEREPACVACGRSKQLEVHHIIPYHVDQSLELDPGNLITLCADPCHLVHGHLMNFQRSNPHVRQDAQRYYTRLINAQ